VFRGPVVSCVVKQRNLKRSQSRHTQNRDLLQRLLMSLPVIVPPVLIIIILIRMLILLLIMLYISEDFD